MWGLNFFLIFFKGVELLRLYEVSISRTQSCG